MLLYYGITEKVFMSKIVHIGIPSLKMGLSCRGGLDLLPRFQPVWGIRPMGPTQGMGGRKVSKHRHLFITLFQTTAPKEPTAHHATASTPLHAVIPSFSGHWSQVI